MLFRCERPKPGKPEARTAVPATHQPLVADPADAAGEGARGTAFAVVADARSRSSKSIVCQAAVHRRVMSLKRPFITAKQSIT